MIATMDTQKGLIPAFTGALNVYDPGTARHSTRVAITSDLLAERLRFSPQDREALWWAGTLHDLGKLGIPAEIIKKPGALNDEEWEQIHRHPTIGADIVLSVSAKLSPIAEAIRAHHERWDGGGYPNGLRGQDIPLLGRIIALADVYDSTTSARPYRKGRFTVDEALELIQCETGRHFDPELAPTFIRLVREQLSTRPNPRAIPHGRAGRAGGRPLRPQNG